MNSGSIPTEMPTRAVQQADRKFEVFKIDKNQIPSTFRVNFLLVKCFCGSFVATEHLFKNLIFTLIVKKEDEKR